MRGASSGVIHASSSSSTGGFGPATKDGAYETGNRFYIVFIGIFVAAFLLSYVMQPWYRSANSQSLPRPMNSGPAIGEQSVNTQQNYYQSNQSGAAYGGAQYAAQPPSYQYGNNGQQEMRSRTNVNR